MVAVSDVAAFGDDGPRRAFDPQASEREWLQNSLSTVSSASDITAPCARFSWMGRSRRDNLAMT